MCSSMAAARSSGCSSKKPSWRNSSPFSLFSDLLSNEIERGADPLLFLRAKKTLLDLTTHMEGYVCYGRPTPSTQDRPSRLAYAQADESARCAASNICACFEQVL